MSIQQMLVGAVSGPVEFTMSVSPTSINESNLPNGQPQPRGVIARVSNGVGPFTYSWAWQSGGVGISLTNFTTANCTITATGTNQLRSGTLRCTVTDTGDGGLQKGANCVVNMQFGVPI